MPRHLDAWHASTVSVGLIARIDHQIGSTSLASIDYQYDANGNRTQQIEQNGRGEERTEYQYDNDDRLTEIHYPDVPQGEGTDVTLTYDQVGNRTSETVYNRSLAMDVSQKTYNYNARHQLISVTDSLNSNNNATWACDAAGNQTQHISNGVTTTYQYNLRQRMSAVIRDGLTIQTARYDHNGLRIEAQSTTGTKRYSYDGLSPITVHDGDNHLLMRYHYGAGQLERLFDTQKGHQYYHNYALGSPIVITDANRTAVAYYAYDAFGQYRRQENINTQNIFGFTGHEWDEDTQLLYAKARYYDPDTARFLSQDPFEGHLNTPPSLHKYLYAYQNPTVFVDPDGREAATALEILGHSLQKAPSVSTFTTGTAANAATYETMASRLLSSPGGMATGGILTSIAGPGGAVGLSIASPNKEARIVTLNTGIGDATFDIYSRDKYISPAEEAALRMQYHRNVVYQSDLMEKDTAESLDSRVFLQQNDLSRRTHQNAGGRLLSNQEYMAEVMKEENGTANINVENVGSADAKSVGVPDNKSVMKPNDGPQIPLLSSYEDRLNLTPVNNGHWTGERGESNFIFDNPDIQKILPDGIAYKNAYPDFSPVTLHEVRLEKLISTDRDANFKLANQMLAKDLGVKESDIAKFMKKQKYTWHEVEDMRTMQMVPSFIHTGKVKSMDFGVKYGHFGGIGERNLLEMIQNQ